MGLLEGKKVLITGGTRGIGRTIALRFASEGADIAFTGRKAGENSAEVEQEIKNMGRKVKFYEAEVSDFKRAHEVVEDFVKEFGRIDVLVNNAGIVDDALLLRMSEEQFDRVISVDLKGAFNYVHAVTPAMARQRSGSIVNISSLVGVAGDPGQCNYSAAKAGMIGLSKSVAKEMGCRGIRSNCVAPGLIESEMTANIREDVRDFWINRISMHRAGTLDEVAGVALFLASDLSTYVSGQVINCCGALVC